MGAQHHQPPRPPPSTSKYFLLFLAMSTHGNLLLFRPPPPPPGSWRSPQEAPSEEDRDRARQRKIQGVGRTSWSAKKPPSTKWIQLIRRNSPLEDPSDD